MNSPNTYLDLDGLWKHHKHAQYNDYASGQQAVQCQADLHVGTYVPNLST